MTKDRFIIGTNDEGKNCILEIGKTDFVYSKYYTVESVVDVLNEQNRTIWMWVHKDEKLTKLLLENTKPTTWISGGEDAYLDIDLETKRCKYEDTVICNKCGFFSSYFLNCRLMMEDNQYRKAVELGLVEE